MAYREFHYRWEYDHKASPEQLWPLVADTNRFNRDTGVPEVQVSEDDREAKSNGVRRLSLSKFGLRVEWEEEPFEWIRPYRFAVVRRYLKGPVAQMRVQAELKPMEAGGTHLVYEVWAQPKSALGLTAIPLQIGLLAAEASARPFAAMTNWLRAASRFYTSPRRRTSRRAGASACAL